MIKTSALKQIGLHSGLIIGLVVGAFVVTTPMAKAVSGGTCEDFSQKVPLVPGGANDQIIKGTYCQPSQWAAGGHQLDVLVHGATYDRAYWDWPLAAPTYSYATKTLQAGRAVVFYDRLGTGASSRPLASSITEAGESNQLHQIITKYKTDYTKTNLIGHSFGAEVAINEAGTYKDVSRLIVTGLFHGNGPAQLTAPTSVYPAATDPQFITKISDAGYLTTRPGVRGKLFYSNSADHAVISYDEAHKDVVSSTSFGNTQSEFETPSATNVSRNVTVPVYSIDGNLDAITCGLSLNCNNAAVVQANEQQYFAGSPSVSTKVVMRTGHDIALHPSAQASFEAISGWIERH